ncbi:MAG: C39 family peptidase [Anaerolineaceae bacterium]|nr:C39 family peptidase [Anaerolineaceae bacterium]
METNSTEALKLALQLARHNKLPEAKFLLRKLLLTEKDNDKAWTLLGMISTSDRERLNCYRQALRINPNNRLARENLNRHHPQRSAPAPTPELTTPAASKPTAIPASLLAAPVETLPLQTDDIPLKPRSRWLPKLALCVLSGILLGMASFPFLRDSLPEPQRIVQGAAAAQILIAEEILPNPTQNPALDDLTEVSEVILFTSTPTQEQYSTPTPTETRQPPPTITAYPTNTHTPTVTPTIPPTATPLPPIPESAAVTVHGTDQLRALSCESSAAVDWARYYGVNIGEMDFHNNLPKSDNPEIGFVGNVNGHWGQIPPNPYGVHAEPVAALLRSYGLHAEAVKNFTIDELKYEIAAGNPVIVWFVGKGWTAVSPTTYTAEDGTEVTVAPYEHVVLAVGYGTDSITILDGTSIYYRSYAAFDQSWSALHRMAIVYRE